MAAIRQSWSECDRALYPVRDKVLDGASMCGATRCWKWHGCGRMLGTLTAGVDTFLRSAGNPNLPPLGVWLDEVLTPAELTAFRRSPASARAKVVGY